MVNCVSKTIDNDVEPNMGVHIYIYMELWVKLRYRSYEVNESKTFTPNVHQQNNS